jgi:cysteine-rich repeat protein
MRIISIVAVLGALWARVAGAAPCTDLATIRQTVEEACACASQTSAGAYKQCVKAKLKADGVKGPCKKLMMTTAAKSVCGKSGFVVCCTAGKKGKVIKSSTSSKKCKKGTVCTSGPANGFSVFPLTGADCSAAGECPTTTTTTTTTTGETTTTSTTLASLCVGVDGLPNGTKEGAEECDDGNIDPTDGCTAACTSCGNGTKTFPEGCDDGNLVNGDGCDANCQPTGCGNGLLVPPETCDDGNTSNDDACPSDCIIDTCTPNSGTDVPASVTIAGNDDIGAVTVLVDYPEGKVSILGSGGAVPAGILTDNPDLSTLSPNDYDHALKAVVLGAPGSPILGLLFKIHFESCDAASAITAGDFTCTVLDAANTSGDHIPSGVTCAVTVP